MKNNNLSEMNDGKYTIIEDSLFLILEHVTGKTKKVARLEAHRKNIDIQIVLKGKDTLGWSPLKECTTISEKYDADKDIMFLGDDPQQFISLPEQQFVLFLPEDAHAPLACEGQLRKAVFKLVIK